MGRGEPEEVYFNVNAQRATEQQPTNSFKQRQSKIRTFQESEVEIESEDVLNLMVDYFNKKLKISRLK